MLLKGEIKDKTSKGRSGFRYHHSNHPGNVKNIQHQYSASNIHKAKKDTIPWMMHIFHLRQTQAN